MASLAEGKDKEDDGEVNGRDQEDFARVQSGRQLRRVDLPPEVGEDHLLDAHIMAWWWLLSCHRHGRHVCWLTILLQLVAQQPAAMR